MAISRPTTKSKISTTDWGIPVTDEVNRLTTVTTPGAWAAIILQSGYGGEAGFQLPQYRINGTACQLRGSVQPPASPNGKLMWTMPVNARPPTSTRVFATFYDSTAQLTKTVRADIDPAYGNLVWYDFAGTPAFLILNGIVWYLNA